MKEIIMLICFSVFTVQCLANDIYQLSVASPNRSAEDNKADAGRRPEQILRFFNIQPGQNVLDLFSGGGYYTELTAYIVGDEGHVDAHNNNAYIEYIGEEKLLKRYQKGRLTNVRQLHQEANDLSLCTGCYDRVLMVLTFHDLFYVDEEQGWPRIDAAKLMQKVALSLKAEGMIGIVDHKAEEGADIKSAQILHRIDPQIIKNLMADWGFRLIRESNVLSHPEDQLALPMWDKTVRGKTDRAVMLFAKAPIH